MCVNSKWLSGHNLLSDTGLWPIARPVRIGLISIAGVAGFLLLSAIVLVVFFDLNAYRRQVQAAASTALGMELSIDGRLGLGFSPGPYLTLSHVQIRNQGEGVASATAANVGIDLMPLVLREIRINRISLKEPVITIDRDRDGNFNFTNPERPERAFAGLEIPEISFTRGTLRYFDQRSELLLEATDCQLDAQHLKLASGNSGHFLKQVSFAAKLDCGEFRKNEFAGTNLKIRTRVNDGAFTLDPVTMELFGAQGAGKVHANFSGDKPRYELVYALPALRTEAFFDALLDEPVLEGPMDFAVDLKMVGDTYQQSIGSATGSFSLRASHLTLTGSDLDDQFNQFESSQNFSLVDAGAFFFVGPLGLVVTKGYDFAGILGGSGGTTEIRALVSDWNVEQGVARALDVAMATNQHRIALQGELDFANEQFRDVTLALVDARGCAQVKQKISGAFQQPDIENPGIIKSLTGPIRTLVKKGVDLFTSDDCEVFYSGQVPPSP